MICSVVQSERTTGMGYDSRRATVYPRVFSKLMRVIIVVGAELRLLCSVVNKIGIYYVRVRSG